MDPPVKSGPLLLQQPPGLLLGAKRWKKSWFVLYPASPHGVARLEFFDCKEGAAAADRISTKRLDKKIVRLADCVSVAPALDCSPKEGLVAFCLETSSRTYVFASEPPEAADWMAKLCEAAFLTHPGKMKMTPSATEAVGERDLEMATNSIYYSREEVNEFWVTVQKTEAAERCKLQGRYLLKASWNELILREAPSSLALYTWPYRLLRRYGRDKVMFSFEAGRRCESGAGNFTFETKQGNEIFHVVEAAIQAQKAQVEEHRQSSSSLEMEAPGISSLQSAMANSLSLEGEGTAASLERRAPRSALAARPSVAGEGKEATVPKSPWLGCPSLRPSPPGTAGSLEDTSNVYSEPLDALKGTRLRPDSLYADPLDSQWQEEGPGSSLAEEQPRPRTGEGHGLPSDKQHIYDEPEGRAPWPTPASAAIYDEARLPCEAWRTQGLESQAGYEFLYLPGTGDYAVPAFHQKAGLKPSRPSPAPKPPRAHKKPAQPEASKPRAAPTPGLEGPCNSNNSNNGSDPLYSRVVKPPSAPGPLGPEQSVDEGRPAAVYEDLGEI